MPGAASSAASRRCITVRASSALRSARGLRLMSMRPLFKVALLPSTPTSDDTLATAGSASTMRLTAWLRSAIAANEIEAGAWVVACNMPVSCTGKKPLGTVR
jgi:hypothetical protein